MLLLNEEISNLWPFISSSMSYLLSQMLSFFFQGVFYKYPKLYLCFFPVYFLIQISFTELWEVLCNKDIKQLMDEAEHDIRIMLVEKCFILRKPHPINVFLFIQNISNYKIFVLSSSVSGYGSVQDYKIFAKGCSL